MVRNLVDIMRRSETPTQVNGPEPVLSIVVATATLRAVGCIALCAVAKIVRCTDREISDQIEGKLYRNGGPALAWTLKR